MGTFIWLVIATLVGAIIGHLAFGQVLIGAGVGFIVGVLIRCGAADDVVDLFD